MPSRGITATASRRRSLRSRRLRRRVDPGVWGRRPPWIVISGGGAYPRTKRTAALRRRSYVRLHDRQVMHMGASTNTPGSHEVWRDRGERQGDIAQIFEVYKAASNQRSNKLKLRSGASSLRRPSDPPVLTCGSHRRARRLRGRNTTPKTRARYLARNRGRTGRRGRCEARHDRRGRDDAGPRSPGPALAVSDIAPRHRYEVDLEADQNRSLVSCLRSGEADRVARTRRAPHRSNLDVLFPVHVGTGRSGAVCSTRWVGQAVVEDPRGRCRGQVVAPTSSMHPGRTCRGGVSKGRSGLSAPRLADVSPVQK
jgi:hypothetical protein